MPKPDLSAYLAALPESRRAESTRLTAAIGAVEVPASNASLVFLAGRADHPVFDDAPLVLWKAVEQMQLREARTDGELPLVYWGFHSIDLLARRRANGVLLTDRTLYLVDVGRSSSQRDLSSVDAAGIRVEDEALVVDGPSVGLRQAGSLLEAGSGEDAAAYLAEVVRIVQRAVGSAVPGPLAGAGADAPGAAGEHPPTGEAPVEVAAAEPAAPERPATVDDLVQASRLSGDLLLPSRKKDVKALAKLAAKWSVPPGETVLVSLSSGTLAGVYGIAITDAAVWSRDLMEPVHRTPLAEVGAFEWDADAKGFRVADGHVAPVPPAVTDANREDTAGLLAALVRAAGGGS